MPLVLSITSKSWSAVLKQGEVCSGFSEGQECLIKMPGPEYRMFVDDEGLLEVAGSWVWKPGFFAGIVRAELVDFKDRILACYQLDVSPHPDKLGSIEFQRMLESLWDFDPALVIGEEPSQSTIGQIGDDTSPWLQYARLRAYGELFVHALTRLNRRPITSLSSERQFVPLQSVRRADRQTALTAMRCQQGAVLFGQAPYETAAPVRGLFDVPRTVRTLDCPANRCIAAVTIEVSRRINYLLVELQRLTDKETPSETRTPLLSRWPRRKKFLSRLAMAMRKSQKQPWFDAVSSPEITSAGLNAVSADPDYSAAYRLAWKILRIGVNEPPSAEELWICPTWEIYERWCFCRLVTMYKDLYPNYEWRLEREHASSAKAAVIGANGDGRKIQILLQPVCPAGDQNPRGGFQSVSGRREPDIAIVRSSTSSQSWIVLDAKYRTARSNVLDAMSSAHIYHDSLRLNGQKPEMAILLVPRSGGAVWLEAAENIQKNRVGVLPFSINSENGPHFHQILKG